MTDLRRKRIVYMSDQEWADARKKAAPGSVSDLIRRAVSVSHPAPSEKRVASVTADGFGHSVAAPKPGAKKR